MNNSQIKEIQLEYIDIIVNVLKKELTETKLFNKIEDFEKYTGRDELWTSNLKKKIESLIEKLELFWNKYDSIIEEYCNKSTSNKIILWPDSGIGTTLPKMLLYYDTALIPDPLTSMGRNVVERGFFRDMIAFFSIIVELEPLVKADTDVPLIIFTHYKKSVNNSFLENDADVGMEFLNSSSGRISISAYCDYTGMEDIYSNWQSLFLAIKMTSLKKLNNDIKPKLIREFLNKYASKGKFQAYNSDGKLNFYHNNLLEKRKLVYEDFIHLFTLINGGFTVEQTREFNALSLNANNLVSEDLSNFQKYKYDKIAIEYGKYIQASKDDIINYSLNHSMNWLENLSYDDLIFFRESGYLENFRRLVRLSSNDLKISKLDDFKNLASEFEQILKNELEKEFHKDSSKIKSIKNKKIKTIASFSLTTGLTISSIAFPALLPLTLISAGYGLVAGASAKDLVNDLISGNSKLKNIGTRPMSVMLKPVDSKVYS